MPGGAEDSHETQCRVAKRDAEPRAVFIAVQEVSVFEGGHNVHM